MNLCLLTDSYKVSHWRQYPKATTSVYSYFESRGGLFPETLFFGLQYIIKKYLMTVPSMGEIEQASELYHQHFRDNDGEMFNKAGWEYVNKLGYLPVRIKAVPEGTVISYSNVLMTIENTDPACFWLTNYLETLLSQVWYPTTVATISYQIRELILSFLEKTGDPSLIDFKLHDFGFRGVSSVESAGIGGLAHLVNFRGSDTIAAVVAAQDFYNCSMAAFAIPASEHSTITSWMQDGEVDAFRNMIEQYGDMPLYACVSDSYDIYRACREYWGSALKDEVLGAKGTLVVRPDSGTPSEVVLACLNLLGDKFGYSYNRQQYKVLNPKVRVIQGDGVDFEEIRRVLTAMEQAGWSADNVAFGMGGALLQKLNRDTQKFAFKCSSVVVNGQQRDVFKCPITDRGKQSKKGKLALVSSTLPKRYYKTIPADSNAAKFGDLLTTVFEDGKLLKDYTLHQIRGEQFR